MVNNRRFFYFIITVLVVFLGILSRIIDAIPLFVGDVLYAVMVYFGFRILLLRGRNLKKIMFPLCFCFLIELQQIYDAKWIVAIRNTTLGHYALGQGFLWSDLVCYSLGIGIAFLIDVVLLKRVQRPQN